MLRKQPFIVRQGVVHKTKEKTENKQERMFVKEIMSEKQEKKREKKLDLDNHIRYEFKTTISPPIILEKEKG